MSTDLHLPVADTSTGTTAAQVLAGLAGAAALPLVVLVGAPGGWSGVVLTGVTVALVTLAAGFLLGRLEVPGGATSAGFALAVAVPLLALAVGLTVALTSVGPGTAALAAAGPVAVLAALVAALGVRTLVVVPDGSGFVGCVAWVGVAAVLVAAWSPLLLGQQRAADHRGVLAGQVEAAGITPYLPEIEGYDVVDLDVRTPTAGGDGTTQVALTYRSEEEGSGPLPSPTYVSIDLRPSEQDACSALTSLPEDCTDGPDDSVVVDERGTVDVALSRDGALLVASSEDVERDTLIAALVDAPVLTPARFVRAACPGVDGEPGATICVE
ncbi:hypothetical protein INN71_16865 [Nocardioides sp. ChNu-153]|uniref:hypothetical protein n=1 Tax=unclassified Nocardioides TaxID=2615069 RepID=UPI00240625B5|nr:MULTISPECIES: hypothetical protein [unclassified Nocardioides]MDF9716653.1 hypothetical protein [Nocardioides sp. ChNu-99]MDN7123058.1 hypothetical protein [Nocardioides sp. ChNu-153]